MKAIKLIVGLLLAVVLVVVVVSVVFLGNLNSLVKTAVEEVGSDVLGTKVTLSEADIQLTEARGVLRGLTIQNPRGFSNAKLLTMDEVLLDLDLKALQEKLVAIEQVRIAGASVLAEQKETTTNMQVLLDNLKSQQSDAGEVATSSDSSADQDVRIKISRFDFVNASATVLSDQFGEASLDMPDVNLRGVGGDKGLPPSELANALVKPILESLKQNMQGLLKGMAEEKLREELKKQEDKAREKLKEKEDELKVNLEDKLSDDQAKQLDSLKSFFK
jgi:hypothetical protein